MAWTNYQIFLAGLMLVTGSINTLSAKWADKSKAKGVYMHMDARLFDHPFLQAVGMFLGELSCLVMFHIVRVYRNRRGIPQDLGNQRFNRAIFLPAALCDMCGTSIMYIGLNLTRASSFQMLRGAVIVFTALLSVAFLRRRIRSYMWVGIAVVIVGLVLVGVSDIVMNPSKKHRALNDVITGDLLIIMAQVIVAIQMVYEEKFVMKHNVPPLQAVGWEGFFGFTVLGTLLVPFYFIKAGLPFTTDPEKRLENSLDAFAQMGQNWQIIVATLGNILSIAFFNFSGISVTKELSATTRMVLDSARTLVVWAVSLGVWQRDEFKVSQFFVQAAGFMLLVVGMSLYNDIIFLPFLRSRGCCGLQVAPPDAGPSIQAQTHDPSEVDESRPLLSQGGGQSRYVRDLET